MKILYGVASGFMMVMLALAVLMAPSAVLADGYSPLDLPPRGDGPIPSVQGENTDGEEEASPSATPSPTGDEEQSITGSIQSVEDGKLVVEVDGENRELEVGDDVTITRDGQEVALSEIQSGDTATVERDDNGDIVEVRVASQQSMNFWRGFLPILLVVLVGFYFLSRRRGSKTT